MRGSRLLRRKSLPLTPTLSPLKRGEGEAQRGDRLPDLSFLLVQALNGLASASSLFIISAGLTIVFGVTRIVNFAHGSFYMLGAYLGVTLIPRLLDVSNGFPMFAIGVLAAALGVGADRRADGGRAAAAHLPRAGAVPAARHLRRGARRAGPGAEGVGPARHPGSARAGARACGRHLRPSLSRLRAVPDRHGPAGAGPAVAADAQDALRRAGARRHPGPRDGGRAGRQPGPAVHRHAVPRRGAGRSRRRPADAQARRQSPHGHLGDRRGLRRHRGRRHGLGARRVPGGAADRPAAGLRHPDLPEDHAGAGVPADGAGAGDAALGPDGPAGRRHQPRGAARGHRAAVSLRPARARGVRRPGPRAAGAAAGGRRLSRQGGDRGAVLCARRLQPEFPDRRRRHRQLRARRLLRPRRLCGGLVW